MKTRIVITELFIVLLIIDENPYLIKPAKTKILQEHLKYFFILHV
jgi:hypothetical protein